jgi:peptidoglycan hydrolase-like protein with peptidoglycan-binding domain
MVCQPYNSAGAGCLYSAQYYKQAGHWTNNPKPGDQIFFTYSAGEVSHTGIVEAVSSGMVTTIEGNSSDQVSRRTYSMSSASIYGYGRPRWELASNGDVSAVFSNISDRILRMGVSGDDVKDLQQKLMKLGYDLGKWGADGDFGTDTYNAVKKFQAEHGLDPVDGEVGPDTRKALESALNTPKPKQEEIVIEPVTQIPFPNIRVRKIKMEDEGSDVKLAQAALQCWGYTIVVTGIFGKEMDEKIRHFQKAKGLDPDGEIGPKTWGELLKV